MPSIHFRPLLATDFQLLLDWLRRPHVICWWDDGDDTIAKVAAHYGADDDAVNRFILELDGEAAGYFQYCRLGPGHIGIDQFLADADRIGKGIGARCITAFIDLIGQREAPAEISADPDARNGRAIRCYEKCGMAADPARSDARTRFMARRFPR